MIKAVFLVLLTFWLSYSSNANEQRPSWGSIHFGALHSGNSKYVVKTKESYSAIDINFKGRASFAMGSELYTEWDNGFGLGVVGNVSEIKSNGLNRSRYFLSLLLSPKVKLKFNDKYSVTFGVGFGPRVETTGESFKDSSGEITLNESTVMVALALAPSMSINYNLRPDLFIGIRTEYQTSSSIEIPSKVYSGATKVDLKVDRSQTFFITAIQVGLRLGYENKSTDKSNEP